MLVYRHPPLTLTRAAWTMNTEAFDHAMFVGTQVVGTWGVGTRVVG